MDEWSRSVDSPVFPAICAGQPRSWPNWNKSFTTTDRMQNDRRRRAWQWSAVTARESTMTSASALPRSLRKTALGLTSAAVAFGFSVSAANAASDLGHQPARVASGWGAAPITLSLIDSARREGPVRGTDSALAGARQRIPVGTVEVGYHPVSIPLPVASGPARGM
jgi:hypothetical protein